MAEKYHVTLTPEERVSLEAMAASGKAAARKLAHARVLPEAKLLTERWRVHYNTVRPHSPLRYRPPAPEAVVPPAEVGATPQASRASATTGQSPR